jgi:hypothetical protein
VGRNSTSPLVPEDKTVYLYDNSGCTCKESLKDFNKGPNPMRTSRRIRLCSLSALLFCIAVATLSAQSPTSQEPHCFSIHVRLNGKLVDGPQIITLKTKQNESTASLEGACFKVPSALLTEKALDVSFSVSGNRVYLSGIATGFFASPWDIDLADKKFGSEVSLPKHAHAKEACAVVFHMGEPETALVQTGCRSRFRGATSTTH